MLLNNNISSYSTYANTTNKRLAIYQVAQEKNFWCGYAAIKSLLDFEKVDMTTMVIIGNKATYIHDDLMITPRGYNL